MMTLLPVLFFASGCEQKQGVVTGEVDATEVDVGVKIAGRLSAVNVHEGDIVKKGQILGNLESRELEAKLQAVQAAQQEAKEQFDLADKSFNRVKNLYHTGVVPKQQFDETKYKYEAAKQKIEATAGQVNEVKAYYDEMLLKAPIDGEVVQVVSHAGEIVSPGYPVVTILDLSDQWVTFNAREDRLKDIRKGKDIMVTFPALGNKTYTLTVNYISALGTFAKWKATNEQGSFDLKTFEVRARGSERNEALRPGMTALIRIK
jgi:HlyD family secretion protein